MTFTPAQLDALEAPKRRKRVRVGSAKDDTGASERAIQRAIIAALRLHRIKALHVPNGSHLAGDAAARMRQMAALRADGMVAGWPDLLIWKRVPGWPPLVGLLEIKRPGGVLSGDQLTVQAALLHDGWPYRAVCSVDEALEAVRGWGWIV